MVTLEDCPLFHQLSPAELKVLRAAALEKTFSPEQEIFKEGDTGDGVYVVKDGSVQISGLIGKDVRHVFSRVRPGDVFGEMAEHVVRVTRKPKGLCAGNLMRNVAHAKGPAARKCRLKARPGAPTVFGSITKSRGHPTQSMRMIVNDAF